MKQIEGYGDITAGDFQELYRLAHGLARERLLGSVRAEDLMTRPVIFVESLTPLVEVAERMARNNVSGVPVVDPDGGVIGILSEHDFLKRLLPPGPGSFIGLVYECLRNRRYPEFWL